MGRNVIFCMYSIVTFDSRTSDIFNYYRAFRFVGGVLGMCMLTSSVVQAVTHARHHQEYLERRVKSKEDSPLPTPKD